MNLVLFDLDNTLLAGDSDHAWAEFLIGEGILDRAAFEARNDEYYEQYKAGTLDIFDYLAFQSGILVGKAPETLAAWHNAYMEKAIRPMILPKARQLIDAHHGDLMALVTATNDFVTAPIAVELGIPHLIASQLERNASGFTGRGCGTPAFQAGKIARVREWLQSMGTDLDAFPRSTFYSDSRNDLPLLETVTHPVAVDPDPFLESVARERGWSIISLR